MSLASAPNFCLSRFGDDLVLNQGQVPQPTLDVPKKRILVIGGGVTGFTVSLISQATAFMRLIPMFRLPGLFSMLVTRSPSSLSTGQTRRTASLLRLLVLSGSGLLLSAADTPTSSHCVFRRPGAKPLTAPSRSSKRCSRLMEKLDTAFVCALPTSSLTSPLRTTLKNMKR